MRTIDISTSQKVTITHELATLGYRIIAYLLDRIFLTFFVLFLYIFLYSLGELFLYFVYLPIWVFYVLLFEIFMDGQTPGKRIMGIKVIKLNGREPSVSDYLIRWIFRMLDISMTLGVVASLLISSTDKSQRLGGILSHTTVINLKPKLNISLNEVLGINSGDNYEATYPEVRNFSEDDMLLIKSLIERIKRYPNKAHKEALNDLCVKVSNQLGINPPTNQLTFLKTLLNDYIVLTR